MTYLDRISAEHNLSMDRMMSISRSLLPSRCKGRPWVYAGNHGVELLSSEEQMDAYLAAYGEMHIVKCRAALQNFPFDTLPFNVEIVDWGCGQGIASLTLLDVLQERDLLDRIRKITLIEPSPATLARADANIRSITYGKQIEICSVNKYLPGEYSSSEAVSRIPFEAAATIHLFSNILDIPTISLQNTAKVLLSSGRKHYVICTGPVNGNSRRIDEFCQLLNVTDYFSNITSSKYAYTSDTHHPYGCVIRGFVIENVSSAHINESVELGHYDIEGAYSDYDREAIVRNGLLSEGVFKIYDFFASRLLQGDSIFIKPQLESDNPDILVIRPHYGILIVKVFDIRVTDLEIQSDGTYKTQQDDKQIFISSPITTVLGYKQNLESQYSRILPRRMISNKSAYYIVKTAVYFPNLNVAEAKDFCQSHYDRLNYSDKNCVAILGKDSLCDNIWGNVGLERWNSTVDDTICNEVVQLVSSKWHSYRDGDSSIKLTKEQRDFAVSHTGDRKKIKGVAGSGKTQVLVSRAVNCQMRTGGKTLILTYNITLANYIKSRLAQVQADFLWDNFVLGTYYKFFTAQAKNCNRRLNIDVSYENEAFFDGITDLQKYDAILIDEVQDYKTEWLKILQKYFLKEGGEFVVFGDVKQNIYKRPVDDSKEEMVSVPGVPGRWSILHKSHRAENAKMLKLAIDYQRQFMRELSVDEIDSINVEIDYSALQYFDMGPCPSDYDLFSACLSAISKCDADINKTVILSTESETLRALDYCARQRGMKSLTMCETIEVYNKLKKDNKDRKWLKDELEDIRGNKKYHFSMLSEGLKMSTIHSFKGWEAETVILIIPPVRFEEVQMNEEVKSSIEPDVNLIYTAITRAKKNLAIINMGNSSYAPFFKDCYKDSSSCTIFRIKKITDKETERDDEEMIAKMREEYGEEMVLEMERFIQMEKNKPINIWPFIDFCKKEGNPALGTFRGADGNPFKSLIFHRDQKDKLIFVGFLDEMTIEEMKANKHDLEVIELPSGNLKLRRCRHSDL